MDDVGKIGMSDMYGGYKSVMAKRIFGLTITKSFWIWIILIGTIGMDLERTP